VSIVDLMWLSQFRNPDGSLDLEMMKESERMETAGRRPEGSEDEDEDTP
jgi:hypothetical protein